MSVKYWYGCIGLLLVLASVVRLYQLGNIPYGLTWDEIAIGYNGWAVIETKRDQWLQLLPISFQSFGDYKAPFALYITGLFTYVFGLHELSVRLPFAISGIIAVAAMGWLTHEWLHTSLSLIQKQSKNKSIFSASQRQTTFLGLSTVSMFLVAFSPWHIHLTRIGFESGMALTFILVALASWYRMMHTKNMQWIYLFVISMSAAIYTYHSSKLVAPLVTIALLIKYRGFFLGENSSQLHTFLSSVFTVMKRVRHLFISGLLGVVLMIPFLFDVFYRSGNTRFTQTTIFSTDHTLFEKLTLFIQQYAQHLHLDFLVLGTVDHYRQGMGEWGVLLPLTFITFTIGIATLVHTVLSFDKGFSTQQRTFIQLISMPLLMVLIGFIPGALGVDESPHSIRTLNALPGIILIGIATLAYYLERLYSSKMNTQITGSHGEKNSLLHAVIGTLITVHIFTVLAMLHTYFYSFPSRSAHTFQGTYLEVMRAAYGYLAHNDTKNTPKVREIVLDTAYGEPILYTLFANKINPYQFHGGALEPYTIKSVDVGDFMRSNALLVATQPSEQFKPEKAEQLFYDQNGTIQFMFFITDSR